MNVDDVDDDDDDDDDDVHASETCLNVFPSMCSPTSDNLDLNYTDTFLSVEALRQLAYLYGLPALDAEAARQPPVITGTLVFLRWCWYIDPSGFSQKIQPLFLAKS